MFYLSFEPIFGGFLVALARKFLGNIDSTSKDHFQGKNKEINLDQSRLVEPLKRKKHPYQSISVHISPSQSQPKQTRLIS